MRGLKVQKLAKELEELRRTDLRDLRQTTKKQKVPTHSFEIQCQLITF
jgi:hypothetical protein